MNTTVMAVRVGDRTTLPGQLALKRLEESGICLPSTSSVIGRIVAELSMPSLPGATLTALQWVTHRPVSMLDTIHVESVVTRVSEGAVERHIRLLDETGELHEEGTEIWRPEQPVAEEPALDFCSVRWGRLLRTSLEGDPSFASSLATWDGTIGLRCGDRELHLRVYRGQIIDITRRVPHGATFTFVAPAQTWVDVVLSDHDDFMRRAIGGEFSSTGDGYEYLRLTKPLNTIIGHARRIAGEARA
ncbi:hypothetical protein [Gordonia rhizosphera]|uniref:Uncharacterized protein n=1 Tax=Gordonia rhizosphera NBRC 16068 TaxID=1108045 RepID=K6V3H1_9ACTN|nr:hypothetical protein [Gordonia rhizosphera]GAB90633.1 hypothetical protein GORHZ_113_00140 [Gordonia rhizosphera NBRC 16068]